MSKRFISSGSPFEEALGYSRAVVQGDWCFVSGITGYDYRTMELPEDIVDQAEACFETLRTVLSDAGFAFSDIVRVTHYVKNRSDVSRLAPVLGSRLQSVRPAATMVVTDLMEHNMLYEIDATAFKG